MKKIFIFILIIIAPWKIYSQYQEVNVIIVSGIVDDFKELNIGTKVNLKNIQVLKGKYNQKTISFIFFHYISEYVLKGDTIIVEILKHDNKYIVSGRVTGEMSYISPTGPFFKINKRNMNYLKVDSSQLLINKIKHFFTKIDVKDDKEKINNIIEIIYDKEELKIIKYSAIKHLRHSIYSQTCFPEFLKKKCYDLYNDTTLDIELRQKAVKMIGGRSKETEMKKNPISLKYLDTYLKPLWENGIKFCDSMINKYETIINGYPVINDTISLSKKDNLFFSGTIKKASKNKLIIKNLKIFEGKYSEDKITLRTDIDTTFNKKITGKNVLLNATLINNKYILELNIKNKGFCMPPVTPDSNNMFIIDETTLKKNNIKIKPNEFLKIISDYYLILNSDIKNKEKELIKNIVKGKYLFLRQRSLWEFSDLSLQYDSVCWDYNKKYNFLDSLSNRYGKYKAPPTAVIATADLLLTKSFNQNYSSKYNTNVYELDYHRNLTQLHRLEGFLNSKNNFAQQYALMRFQDLIKYYADLKKILISRIEKYDN